MRIVADVGGTNTRLAFAQDGHVIADSIHSYRNDAHAHFDAVLRQFLRDAGDHAAERLIVALAGPVGAGVGRLTNRDWHFDAGDLAQNFNLSKVVLLNDLTALGYAQPHLTRVQAAELRAGKRAGNGQALVVGIGTGFNVSPVLRLPTGTHCPAVEAGHVGLPATVARAAKAAGLAPDGFPTVEDLFSGRGFAAVGSALLGTSEPDIIARAKTDSKHRAVVDHYSRLIGWQLRDLARAYLPRDGITLAGGVARAVLGLTPDPCIEVFGQPDDIAGAQDIPLSVIMDDAAALLGCACYAHSG